MDFILAQSENIFYKSVDKIDVIGYNIEAVEKTAEFNIYRGVTQFGRVLGLGPRCRRFKSCHLDHKRVTK